MHTKPVSADIQCESNGSPAQTGCLACLREKLRCRGLSEAAKELLLVSWRSKTSRAYDSHFRKWVGWCTKQGRDPVSGPISDVVNFLADLHTQGYQTNSLNTYRSAMSTVHDRVDDVYRRRQASTCGQGIERGLSCQTVLSIIHHYLECSGSVRWYLKMGLHHFIGTKAIDIQAGHADGVNQAITVGRSGSSFCK